MMCCPKLQSMALTVTALTALLTVSSGSLQATIGKHIGTSSVTRCALTFEVVYPADEGKNPYPICSSRCPAREEVWFNGVAYKHLNDLNRYNLMIEASFKNGKLQGCKMVPLLPGEVLTARQEAKKDDLERCLATKVEGLSDSNGSAFGPAPAKLSGFTRVGNSYYLVTPRAMAWHEGSNFCRQFGAIPAIIESQKKQRLLQEVLTTDVWIGLNDIAMEGKFENIDRSKLNYTNWARDQPNNGNGGNEDCTMMVRSLDFMWIDANCAYKRRVLCEWLASSVLSTPTTTKRPTSTTTKRLTTTTTKRPTTTIQNVPSTTSQKLPTTTSQNLSTTTTQKVPTTTTQNVSTTTTQKVPTTTTQNVSTTTTQKVPTTTTQNVSTTITQNVSTTTTPKVNTTTTTRAPHYTCPAGTHMFQKSSCFLVSGAAITGDYVQARTFCSSRYMTLASIHSAAEQTFVQGLVTANAWIGLNDIEREGTFRWVDGTPLDYKYFIGGQPDNTGSDEDCVEMRKDYGYQWNDFPCRNNGQFVCKVAVKLE